MGAELARVAAAGDGTVGEIRKRTVQTSFCGLSGTRSLTVSRGPKVTDESAFPSASAATTVCSCSVNKAGSLPSVTSSAPPWQRRRR